MRKLLLSALSLIFAAGQAAAQSYTLNEGFEGADVPPSGWTMRAGSSATANKYKWEQVKYTSNPLNLRSGYTHGGDNAMMVSSGKTNTTSGSPDSWLITPAVKVNAGDYLTFMLAYAPVFNDIATVPADQRIKFAVLVSTTGTDAADFTETLMEFAPYGETDWRQKVASLDKFAGQTVYIAFREYGDATVGPVSLNRTWIDDVKVGQTAPSDFAATEIISPVASPKTTQNVSFKFANSGLAPKALTVGYKVNGGDPVEEAIDVATLQGDTTTYTFNLPATLAEGSNTVSVWATADNDPVHDNDTLTQNVTVEKTFALPYEMTSDNLNDGWTYSYHSGKLARGTNTGWWQAPDASYTKYLWTFKKCAKESLLIGKWFRFGKGKVKMKFNYTSGTEVPITLTYTPFDDADGTKAATKEFTLAAATDGESDDLLLDVAEDGVYKLSFKVSDDYVGPFVINTLTLSKVTEGDVAVASVSTKAVTAAGIANPVYARVKNSSTEDMTNIPVVLDVDGTVLRTETVDIPAGEEKDIQFGKSADGETPDFGIAFSEAGDHTVTVYTDFANDTDRSNDTTKVAVVAYDKFAVPYAESFENETNNRYWEASASGDNLLNWTIGSAKAGEVNWAKDGEDAAYMSSVANTPHNACLTSPVIHVAEKGKLRLSYYYTSRMKATNATDTTFIRATVTSVKLDTLKHETIDGIDTYFCERHYEAARTDTITDANVAKYTQGYLLADIPEEGDYYISFHNYGYGHDVVLDDVRLDQATDLAIIGAEQTASSGFGNTKNTITVKVANHGAKDITYYTLALTTELSDGSKTLDSEGVEKTLAPGDTATYSFNNIDISAADTYTYTVKASCDGDADEMNNGWSLDPITTYPNATLPYTADFDTEDQQEQWDINGTWQTGTYTSSSSAYNGTGAISHHKKAADENGDWAFSGCIEIPAGTYDLSFFYRTFLNGKTAKMYAQNFAFYLGKERSAEGMTQLLYTSDTDVIAPEKRYRKVDETFTVAESGKYYIGVKCTSSTAYGVLYIDNISVKESGVQATELKSYTADFNEWHKYDPSGQFAQWAVSDDGASMETSQTVFEFGTAPMELPGLAVSPAFTVSKGDLLKFSFGYEMGVEEATGLSDEAMEQMGVKLYMLKSDNPAADSEELGSGSFVNIENCEASGKVEIQESGVCYFAVGVTGAANSTADTAKLTYKVSNLTVSAETPSAITAPDTAADNKAEVYSANGMSIGTFSSVSEAVKGCKGQGIFVIKTGNGKTVKVVR